MSTPYYPSLGLEKLGTDLKERMLTSSHDVFHILYENGNQRSLLRVCPAEKKIIYDDRFGRPMSPDMHRKIYEVLGYVSVIVDIPKLERDPYAPNKNVYMGENWVDDTKLKLEIYKDAPATPSPIVVAADEKIESAVPDFATNYALAAKKHYGIFVESHHSGDKQEDVVSENKNKNNI